jgi:hypothetical protein
MGLVYRPDHPKANKNGMVPFELAGPKHGGGRAGFYVIQDEMSPTRHMADGKTYTSKHKFREATRAAGCVEVGTEPVRARKQVALDRGQRRDDIRRALYEVRNGERR